MTAEDIKTLQGLYEKLIFDECPRVGRMIEKVYGMTDTIISYYIDCEELICWETEDTFGYFPIAFVTLSDEELQEAVEYQKAEEEKLEKESTMMEEDD